MNAPGNGCGVGRFFLMVMLVSGLAAGSPAFGCAAGWESRLSLLQRSRCVIQIEVLEVEDAPKPKPADGERRILDDDDGEERQAALATVQGKCVGVLRKQVNAW